MGLYSWASLIKTTASSSLVRTANRWKKKKRRNTQHDILCPYITLQFKPTISPTPQAPLACNQWQHLLQCCSATGQYIQKRRWEDYTPVVTILCVKTHLCPADSVQALHRKWNRKRHINPGKVGVLIIRQNLWMPCISSQLPGTHTAILRETMSIVLPTFPLIM